MYIKYLSLVIVIGILSGKFVIALNFEPDFIIAPDSSGDYQSIQQAIDLVPENNSERIIIYIKAGKYEEKVFIDKNCITIIGENPGNTVIELAVLRDDWVNKNGNDWGAAVVNIRASDIIIKNLTVYNSYGDLHDIHEHQFAVRLMEGTRIIFDNCRFIAGGGDTVSLWDKEKGMYYHRNCYFRGYVDFVCPRGWCYITNSRFYEDKTTAAIWHDGELNRNQKFVIKNSEFDGTKGFKLGRRHYDARFYLLNCSFSANMADEPIYRVTYPEEPERDRPNLWGDRYYFFNCHRKSEDFAWYRDNLPSDLSPEQITAEWTFDYRWNPKKETPLFPEAWSVESNQIQLFFNEKISVKGQPELMMRSGVKCYYCGGGGSKIIRFKADDKISIHDKPLKIISDTGIISASRAYLYNLPVVIGDNL
ncbi:MAG: hypothetical protein JXB44_08000 [Calditrichaceae bacterium]|nr:hypothetical protein [Calditrichaceae bacterium]RQV95113.1 MAG: pectin esterase [Calditrichota bacterium]